MKKTVMLAIVGLVCGLSLQCLAEDINVIDTSQTQMVTKVIVDYVVIDFQHASTNSHQPYVTGAYRMVSPEGKTVSSGALRLTYQQTIDAAAATDPNINISNIMGNIMAIARTMLQQPALLSSKRVKGNR
jgi:hypothetical protein